MGRENGFSRDTLPCGRKDHAIGYKSGKNFLIGLLQLTPAAGSEMPARRNGPVRTHDDSAIGRN